MSAVEEQLRSGLEGLGATPPAVPDRVSAVRSRVRRRAQRRAALALSLVVVAGAGAAGLATVPLGGGAGTPLAADRAPEPPVEVLRADELLVPMVEVHVDLGLPREQQDAVVDRELQALQPVPDHVSRFEGDARVVLFTDGLDGPRVDAFFSGVLASAVSPDVSVARPAGTKVLMEAPLSAEVRRAHPGPALPEVPFELERVLRAYAVGEVDGRLRVEYEGPALDQRRLDRVVELVARWAGAAPEDVAVRRGQ